MRHTLPISVSQRRQQAARLIQAVLDEEVSAGYALTAWPEGGSTAEMAEDTSLQAAYQSLWHFEADEDRQKSELFYMDAQLELLGQMTRHLSRGRDLPPYMLNAYVNTYSCKEHRATYYHHHSFFGTLFQDLFGTLWDAMQIAFEAWKNLLIRQQR